jgi:protein tyrosine kinase modulator
MPPDEDPYRERDQAPLPTMRELAMVLFRRRRVFVCVSGLVLAIAALYAFAGVKYQANMKVLVRRGRADAPVSVAESAPLDLTRMAVTEEELNSEVELLRDDEVLRRVVEETGVGGRDWFHFLRLNEGHAERVERAARRLAKKLQVEPMKKTNLIAISYASADPQVAAKVLQSVATVYLEKHMEVHRPAGQLRFFDQQRGESRLQLEEAKGKLLQFTARHGVVEAAQQRDLALQKLSEVDASYRQTRIDLAETQQRVWELGDELAKLPERTTTQVRISDNPELLKSLKAGLLDLQLKRTQLLTKFEPSHRLVQEVDQQIAQTEAMIGSENALPLRDETTDKNVHYEWATSELQRAQVQLKALQAREAATATQETAYRGMARQLGEDAITQDDLLSTEKAAQENYLLYMKKEEEARMDDALDERGIVNVAIAEHPVVPALPLWSVWTVLAMGLAVAGTAGTGAAFAADYLDPAFRTPEDVLAYLNSPVLASLPRRARGSLSA